MSESIIISPLLDGFTLGSPISEHHGVICYPAIKENTNKKYIVKKITIPATQSQFDAFVLAGAYKDPGDVMEYFRGSGEEILQEAEVLKDLSRIDGFLPYDNWQMEAITRRRLGYEIYLVGSYKRSLDKYIRKHAFTHLEAINLSLDLCAALSVCRQYGYLYVDLKPSNIYVSEKKEYRIGDLGFLRKDALRYASLPERYFSPYTPPELSDPMTPMNLTVDTYAVGMILYQLYNDGQLPFSGTERPEDLPTPCNADYEMAEIIMKAIQSDPEQRWTDPKDLGKAIASYMQRNRVNDTPITPFVPVTVNPEDIIPIPAQNAATEELPAESDTVENTQPEDSCATSPEVNESADIPEETIVSNAPEEIPSQETAAETDTEEDSDTISDAVPVLENPIIPDEDTVSEDAPAEQTENPDPVALDSISEETAKIIIKANDIIAHEIPEEISLLTEENLPDPFAFASEDSDEVEDTLPEDPLMDEEETVPATSRNKKTKHFADTTPRKKFKKFVSRCFTFLIFCGVVIGGYWYYQNVYLQTIHSMSLIGTQDQITVLIDTNIEESKLTVRCTDENGKKRSASVQGGKATFTDLKPSTQYSIQLDISGFHKLAGHTEEVFTTDAATQVLSFQAVAGSEDGSVMLNFSVDGQDPDFWNIHYVAEGEDERLETVTGHSAMITGLTIGKMYTFTLDGGKDFDLGGEIATQYLASRLIIAENLNVTSSDGREITVHWDTPGDVVVENWSVRCYDGYDFEELQTVTDNKISFTGLDSGSHYTIEITAAGMTQPSTIYISPDPIHLTEFQIAEDPKKGMTVSWKYSGAAPEGGWLLTYAVDGSSAEEITCAKESVQIPSQIPGAIYQFVLQSADGRTVFNNTKQHKTNAAAVFTEHNFDISNVAIHLLKTPEESGWSFESVSSDAYTDTFAVGDSASMVLQSSASVYLPGNKTKVQFIFRDSYGNALADFASEETCIWKSIWTKGDMKTGELTIPKLPDIAGEYLLELYFNGSFVQQFTITITN